MNPSSPLHPFRLLASTVLLAILPVALTTLHAQAPTPKKKVLFFDDDDVLTRAGTKRFLSKFAKRGPVFAPAEWETGGTLSICSVNFDPARTPRYMMWYQVDSRAKGFTGNAKRYDVVVALATSVNGVDWDRPNLRPLTGFSYPSDGGENNIVLRGLGSTTGHRAGCSILYEPGDNNGDGVDDGEDAARRYKMVFTDWKNADDPTQGVGLQVAFSPDGKVWTKYPNDNSPTLLSRIGFHHRGFQPPKVGYSTTFTTPSTSIRLPMTLTEVQNVFADPARTVNGQVRPKTYIIYGSMPLDGPDGTMDWKRGTGMSTSTDFVTWTPPQPVLFPADSDSGTVTFHDSPVWNYFGVYFCLNQILDTAAGVNEIELMTSRDGHRWDRFPKSLFNNVSILPRSTDAEAVDSGRIFTSASAAVGDNLRIYYGASSLANPANTAICMADLKRDRLVGLEAVWKWGESGKIETLKRDAQGNPIQKTDGSGNPVFLNGKPVYEMILEENAGVRSATVTLRPIDMSTFSTLKINASTRTITGENGAIPGHVEVELLTRDGYVIDAFSKSTCVPFTGDASEAEIKWNTADTLLLAPREELIVRIHLTNATLYSCSFY